MSLVERLRRWAPFASGVAAGFVGGGLAGSALWFFWPQAVCNPTAVLAIGAVGTNLGWALMWRARGVRIAWLERQNDLQAKGIHYWRTVAKAVQRDKSEPGRPSGKWQTFHPPPGPAPAPSATPPPLPGWEDDADKTSLGLTRPGWISTSAETVRLPLSRKTETEDT